MPQETCRGDEINGLRFVTPVLIENFLTVAISFVFSAVVGKLSKSSLAAVSLINTFFVLLTALMCVLTTGSSILTSRYVGAGDRDKTASAIEQSLLLTLVIVLPLTALLLALSPALCRLMLPKADDAFFGEALEYLRLCLFSLPFLMFYTIGGGILRAADDSRNAMLITVVMNLIQIAAAFLLVSGRWTPSLGMKGAGLSMLLCRIFSGSVVCAVLFAGKRYFRLSLRRVFRPERQMIARIFRIGFPSTVDQTGVQFGYLLANTMTVSLGTAAAAVYSVVNAVCAIPSILYTIFSVLTVTYVGHAIGRGDVPGSKKLIFRLAAFGLVSVTAVYAAVFLLRGVLVPMLSADGAIIADSQKMLWVVLVTVLLGVPINVFEPALRCGGDVKYVMIYTIIAVWAVKIPLTYLFCFVLHLGVIGAFYANWAGLFTRCVFGFFRARGKRWARLSV